LKSKYIPKIVGEKVYLSPMFFDDLEQYTRWMNDFEVTRSVYCYSRFLALSLRRFNNKI
jgi:hypothetical protein